MKAYQSKQPTIISFSGGRSSGYMLYHILQAHGGMLPDYVRVVFANTGKESPETLDFVRDCSEAWDVPITWVERRASVIPEHERTGRKKYQYETVVVDYETASRNGEPFASLIECRQYLPNPVQRICTSELKVNAIKQWCDEHWRNDVDTHAIGIRRDEHKRAVKMKSRPCGKKLDLAHKPWLPMYDAGVTKHDVYAFWRDRDFDLQLPNDNGETMGGNCDLCFMKSERNIHSIIRWRPESANWWIDQENKTGSTFRHGRPGYKDMRDMALENEEMDFDYPESLDCFCGD